MTVKLSVAVVIPTLGRPSLRRLLDSLARQQFPPDQKPTQIVIVDDRPEPNPQPLQALFHDHALFHDRGGFRSAAIMEKRVILVRSYGLGPGRARNAGWGVTEADWVAFLDDDVELSPQWWSALVEDLRSCGPDVGGSQGRIEVPLPADRRPTDWERGTAGLQHAAWATADMAYRRQALIDVAGFDERFPRAYREDADLALRVRRAGWQLVRGERRTVHPVRPADDWVSVRVQRGNADDVLMRALHGRSWRNDGEVPAGRLGWHLATTGALVAGALAALAGRRRAAGLAALTWAGLTADFAVRRLLPGPRPTTAHGRAEARRMLLTSVVIPPAAVGHRLRGEWQHRRGEPPWPLPIRAVLFDRDGTLVHDVPYNGDPALVKPMDDAALAVSLVRDAGLATAVVTNQAGIARGLLTRVQVDAVNAEVERQLGPFQNWQVCPHATADGCDCRKPRPGMILAAARQLGVRPQECVVIGDIGADVEAARAAGARAVLVPNGATRPQEIADAPAVADTLTEAVHLVLGRR